MAKNYFSKEVILPILLRHTEEKEGHKLWTGNCNRGHGRYTLYGKTYYVHRLSAFLFLDLDLLDNTIQVNHKRECEYKNCWEPTHLYVGNQYQNIEDFRATKNNLNLNLNKTHCKNGHELNEENTYVRLYDKFRICKTCQKIAKEKYKEQFKPI